MTTLGEGLPPADSPEGHDPGHYARKAALAALERGGR